MFIHLLWIQQGLFWFRFDTDHCWGHSYIKCTVWKEGHKAEFRSFKWVQVYRAKCAPMCAPRCTPLLLVHFLETFKILDNNRTSGSELWIHLLFLCYGFNEDFLYVFYFVELLQILITSENFQRTYHNVLLWRHLKSRGPYFKNTAAAIYK